MEKMYNDFEFERRFLCDKNLLKGYHLISSSLIIQNYFASKNHYSIRIRLTNPVKEGSPYSNIEQVDANKFLKEILQGASAVGTREVGDDKTADLHAYCTIKGPMVNGTRYENENQIDPLVAANLLLNEEKSIVKIRNSVWVENDGWEIDFFGGENYPLAIAECERTSPVVDLKIPKFCVTEITDDHRFSNDSLSKKPYGTWMSEYKKELEKNGPYFSEEFGSNMFLD